MLFILYKDTKMTGSIILKWTNLQLTIEKKEFNYLKCSEQVEKKRILNNGTFSFD